MKPLSPRTKEALRDLNRLWNQALQEEIPEDMKALLDKLK